jgi:hypothetical protein
VQIRATDGQLNCEAIWFIFKYFDNLINLNIFKYLLFFLFIYFIAIYFIAIYFIAIFKIFKNVDFMIKKNNFNLNKRKTLQPFLEKNFDEKTKAISPLIATILLIVVAVAIIGIIVNWGKGLAQDSLSDTTLITDFKTSDASHFVFRPEFFNDELRFTYSPPQNLKNKEIIVDRFQVVGFDEIVTLDEPMTLTEGITSIQNLDLSSFEINTRKVNFVLITNNNEYITLKNIDLTNYNPKLPDLTFSLESGNYTGAINVEIISIVENTNIYYTIDGTTPNNTSTLYSTPITINDDVILKAIAYKNGYIESNVVSQEYTINIIFNTSYLGYVINILDIENKYYGITKYSPNKLIIFDKYGNLENTLNFDTNTYNYFNVTNDGNLIAIGYTSVDILFTKLDLNGNIIWSKTYDGGADTGFVKDKGNYFSDVADGYLISAMRGNNSGYPCVSAGNSWFIKTDYVGNIIWSTFESACTDQYNAFEGFLGSDSNYFFISNYGSPTKKISLYILNEFGTKITPFGNQITISNFYSGYVNLSFLENNNQLYFVGSKDNSQHLVITDLFGNVLSTKTYNFENNGHLTDITYADGHLLVTGYLNLTDNDIYFAKLDLDGNIVWENTFQETGNNDIGIRINPTNDGSYILVGWTSSGAKIIKTDVNGVYN